MPGNSELSSVMSSAIHAARSNEFMLALVGQWNMENSLDRAEHALLHTFLLASPNTVTVCAQYAL